MLQYRYQAAREATTWGNNKTFSFFFNTESLKMVCTERKMRKISHRDKMWRKKTQHFPIKYRKGRKYFWMLYSRGKQNILGNVPILPGHFPWTIGASLLRQAQAWKMLKATLDHHVCPWRFTCHQELFSSYVCRRLYLMSVTTDYVKSDCHRGI